MIIKILVIFGTRPEAIKMCPLIKLLKRTDGISCCTCLTGQHREMLIQIMDSFCLKEDYNLNLMKNQQKLSDISAGILLNLEKVVEKEKPDLILVHGDTSTSFIAALVGFYNKISIGHVEAGLRTYNISSPYPEEFNRQAVDLIAELYFAPTEKAKANLIEEGKNPENIFVTGNTVIDALRTTIKPNYDNEHLRWAEGSKLILMTVHRRENLGNSMRNIFKAVKNIANDFPEVKVIYPIHKNPLVREIAEEVLGGMERIRLIEPLDVIDFHNFMLKSYFILTDSGGIQEEAPALGKPVLLVRNTTERPEGVEAGTVRLIGTREETVYEEIKALIVQEERYKKMSIATNPYGDGHASERIVYAIKSHYKEWNEKMEIN